MDFVLILYFLVLLGASQGILILLALSKIRNGNQQANRILSAFILSITLILLSRLSYGSLFFWQPKLAMVPDIIVFLFGPFIYLYIKALFIPSFKLAKSHWLHFSPAIFHFFILLQSFFIPKDQYLQLYMAGAFYLRNYIILGLALAHGLFYWGLSWRLLRHYRNSAPVPFKSKVNYLKWILGLMGLCLTIWLTSYLYAVSTQRPSLDFHFYNFLWIALSFVTYFLGYFAMTKPEIFQISEVVPPKYQSSMASSELLDQLQKELESILSKKKLYLKPDLTLKELSKQLDSKPHTVSRLINERYQMSFFHLINTYRVQEFIELAQQEEYSNQTYLAIAHAAGFNNKTSFNKAFKRVTQKTPRAYFKEKSVI